MYIVYLYILYVYIYIVYVYIYIYIVYIYISILYIYIYIYCIYIYICIYLIRVCRNTWELLLICGRGNREYNDNPKILGHPMFRQIRVAIDISRVV